MHARTIAVISALALSSCAGRQAPPPVVTGAVLHSSIQADACVSDEPSSCRRIFKDEFSARLPLLSGEIRGGEAMLAPISRQLSAFYGFRRSGQCNELVKGSAFVIVRESAEFRFLGGTRIVATDKLLEESARMPPGEFCQQEEKRPRDEKKRHRQFNDTEQVYASNGVPARNRP